MPVNLTHGTHAQQQTMSIPSVSIVIPVFNAGKYLAAAIGSMIEQTYDDWEMICVNDGSTDSSPDVLDRMAHREPRIKIIHQANGGIVSALNRGCEAAQGSLICRMDADDIAMPHRLKLQTEFMQNHREVVALGGDILCMDSESQPLSRNSLSSDHSEIVNNLLHRKTGLFHPASMIRTDAFRAVGGYRDQYQWIEDHDLWLRLSLIGQLHNSNDLVLCYRQHASSVCWQKSQTQRELMTQLLQEAYAERGLEDLPSEPAINTPRTKANPGKWARMAARGGYPRTACKHLGLLLKQEGISIYSLRMLAEVCLRIPLSASKASLGRQPTAVPDVSKWQSLC